MLDLYVLETCPYSRKVMDFMEENGIQYRKHDIEDEKNLNELIKLGGRVQVPFLYDKDNNQKMYESDDIIEYVKSLDL